MMVLVAFAFEPLVDVEDGGQASVQEDLTGLMGALAAAADEDHGGALGSLAADGSAEQQLADLCGEFGVDGPVRLIDPGDMDGPCWVTDEQILHGGADIHQDRLGVILHQLPSLLGGEALWVVVAHGAHSSSSLVW
jgi:hypothetical protein